MTPRGQRQTPHIGGYGLRKMARGTASYYALSVPPVIGDLIPSDARFDCELVPEGILFRVREKTPEAELPDWVNGRPEDGFELERES